MKSPQVRPQQFKSIRLLQEKYQDNLEIMFKNLLKDETLCDVTIHCKDGCVKAHKIILSAFSPYFKKVFSEHVDPKIAYIIHGVTVYQMECLIELIYRGTTDVSYEVMSKLCQIAEDFGILGIIDENEKSINNFGRDTRFKGQKRVAVDFQQEEMDSENTVPSIKISKNGNNERRTSTCSEKSKKSESQPSPVLISTSTSPSGLVIETDSSPIIPTSVLTLSAAARRSSNWALKQRKYKCDLCPASFKRASHLTRHQLVHTGERPYGCSQCDKAFSRHDKLKHHIRKAHEIDQLESILTPDNLYTIGHIEMINCNSEITEDPPPIRREDLEPPITEKSTEVSGQESTQKITLPKLDPPQKKGRGRPRKYPPAPRPLTKRPRGRPRLNAVVPDHKTEEKPQTESTENYDITNMPFGDIEYLTRTSNIADNNLQVEETSNTVEGDVMEPLVEIQLDSNESNLKQEPNADTFFQNIGLLETRTLTKIGECTVSVTNSAKDP